MKTVVIQGEKRAHIAEVPNPGCDNNLALVRIHSAPMCTEYRKYFKGEKCTNIGHEGAGEIVEAPANSKVKAGQRVIVMPQYPCGSCELCLAGDYIHCENINDPGKNAQIEYGTGTFADYIVKPDWLLLPIPDDLTYDESAMACCALGPALGAGAAMNVSAGETVLVTGIGPVGLGAVIYCTYRSARVIAVGRNAYRRSLALQLGAEAVLDPEEPDTDEKISRLTNGKGVDNVIECAGEQSYQRLAVRSVRRKGQIAFIGESGDFTLNISRDLLRKGLTIHGIWHWNLNYYGEMINLIRASRQKLQTLITHRFPLDKIEEAFELQLSGNCGKVILQP
ncbi:MAG TPA: zinc-binding dehydrogenase [Flavitalea sp.]|nr:zinc-binding dehydrogenase [Flavitalea sp.]